MASPLRLLVTGPLMPSRMRHGVAAVEGAGGRGTAWHQGHGAYGMVVKSMRRGGNGVAMGTVNA